MLRPAGRAGADTAFAGQLTVAAIDGFADELQWFDAVDVVGVDAYYDINAGSEAGMVAAWQPHLAALHCHRAHLRH